MSAETLNNNELTTEDLLNDFFSKEIKEVANSVPEMEESEIKQLNETELHNIYLASEGKTYKDNNGEYIIVSFKNQKRKLYYTVGQPLKNGHTYISVDTVEDYKISIGRKIGDKVVGIYADIENNTAKNIYKGNLIYKNGEFRPKK